MYDGWQQVLVAHHNGRTATVANAVFRLQPLADIACLYILCGGTDEGDVLGL